MNIFRSSDVDTVLPEAAPEEISRERIIAYAGASGDYNPMHVDEVTNLAAGKGGVFAHGMLGTGCLGRLVTDYLEDVPLTALSVRCLTIVRPGDTLYLAGKVTSRSVEGDRGHLTFGLTATNQRGEVTHTGEAACAVPISINKETGDGRHDPLVRWRALG